MRDLGADPDLALAWVLLASAIAAAQARPGRDLDRQAANISPAPATASPAIPIRERQAVCRRPADADAVRHALFLEHHARSRDRHRQLERRRLLRLMHVGRFPDGGLIYPAMPFGSYTKVTREDCDAIFAYLRSVPAGASAEPAA